MQQRRIVSPPVPKWPPGVVSPPPSFQTTCQGCSNGMMRTGYFCPICVIRVEIQARKEVGASAPAAPSAPSSSTSPMSPKAAEVPSPKFFASVAAGFPMCQGCTQFQTGYFCERCDRQRTSRSPCSPPPDKRPKQGPPIPLREYIVKERQWKFEVNAVWPGTVAYVRGEHLNPENPGSVLATPEEYRLYLRKCRRSEQRWRRRNNDECTDESDAADDQDTEPRTASTPSPDQDTSPPSRPAQPPDPESEATPKRPPPPVPSWPVPPAKPDGLPVTHSKPPPPLCPFPTATCAAAVQEPAFHLYLHGQLCADELTMERLGIRHADMLTMGRKLEVAALSSASFSSGPPIGQTAQ